MAVSNAGRLPGSSEAEEKQRDSPRNSLPAEHLPRHSRGRERWRRRQRNGNLIRMRIMPFLFTNATRAARVFGLSMLRHRVMLAAAAAAIAPAVATPAAAQTMTAPPPIAYTLRFPAPQTHYVEVDATFPASGPTLDLMMAVWTPGSYLVREYARHVEAVVAFGPGGRALAATKTRKNRWRIETGGAKSVRVTYRVYGREMSVRTNWVEQGFAMLNGAATFITLVEPGVKRPHVVSLELPAAWKISMSSLPHSAARPNEYRAADFDTLVDSPILAGNPTVHTFEVSGKTHYLVNEGEAGVWDGARAARDLEQIVRATETFWGALPYEKYVFFNMITEASGGLEHRNSTMLMTSRWSTSTRRTYVGWLTLAAHEYFHAWNVKRLRPLELGPFDYESEVYTTSLWVAEGITSYFESLLVRRAGLSTQPEMLDQLSSDIRQLQTTPGRLQQPVETASFDAWIKHYRPDENSPNTAISYYTKGAVLGFLLDAKVRAATGGARSLDDVMRLAFQRFSGARGFTDADFRGTVHEVAGRDFGDWWTKALETTDELDYTEALAWFGLRFRPADVGRSGAGAITGPGNAVGGPAGGPAVGAIAGRAWLGATTRIDNGRLVVSQVRRDTPAYDAGLNVDDEIVAIGEFRVRADQLATRLEQYRPGQTVSLLVARRERLTRLDVTLGREPMEGWRLEPDPSATPEQQARLKAWQGE
jgi:predicted metalloprotease with PDZ domain